jgi:serine/threonine-protein kinase
MTYETQNADETNDPSILTSRQNPASPMNRSLKLRDAAPARPARPPRQNGPTLTVGSWRLLQLLAEGAHARLYRARLEAENREPTPASYVVKVLKAEHQADPRAIDLLRHEAYVGLSVRHPHVIAMFSAHVDRAPHYLVMPFLAGSSLDRRLHGGRRLPIPVALWIARQIAEGLAALHNAGWVHGDVKLANVRVSPEGHATLLDLGLCSPVDRPKTADRPRTADHPAARGTIHYMSPEALTGKLSPASDLYSLGCTLFELLTGRPPFLGRSAAEFADMHRGQMPPDLIGLLPSAAPELVKLLRSLLAKDPLRRPTSAAELVANLVRIEIAAFADRAS